MGIFSKIFKRNQSSQPKRGMEDYMTLIRVYFQASIANEVGINNLSALPDLRLFKSSLHIPTLNNRLGVNEKARCKKMVKELYKTDDSFFKEIDTSIRKNCRKLQDVQVYLLQFNNFTQSLMMLTGNLMKFKLRVPSIFKRTIYAMTEKTMTDIFTKSAFDDPAVSKTVADLRKYNARLGFSQRWTTDFVYQIVMLAKKEPRKKEEA